MGGAVDGEDSAVTEEYLLPPKRKQIEWREQETDKRFLEHALPPDAYWTAIDQGRASSRRIGELRKKRGIKSGIPDWLIVWRGVTLWIERKISRAESELKTNQRLAAERLQANGHRWARANDTFEVEAALRAAGIPLSATYGIRPPQAPRKKRTPRKPAPRTATVAWGHRNQVWK